MGMMQYLEVVIFSQVLFIYLFIYYFKITALDDPTDGVVFSSYEELVRQYVVSYSLDGIVVVVVFPVYFTVSTHIQTLTYNIQIYKTIGMSFNF